MARSFELKKRLILAVLAVALLADLALGVASYQLAAEARSDRQRLLADTTKRKKLLESAVHRAAGIKVSMPAVRQQCDAFENSFRPTANGYSGMLEDVAAIAKKAGLTADNLTLRQADPSNGMVEIEVSASVVGDYGSVVRFINGIQRSPNFYVLEDLSLVGGAEAGNLKLNVHLKTYFRA